MTRLISIGENCLVDSVLGKFNYKGGSGPFGSCRSNVEYVIQIIESDFESFLEENKLYKTIVTEENKLVVKNKSFSSKHNIFCSTVSSDFEFTHHNVLDEKDKDSVLRKIERFRNLLKGHENIILVYNYRYNLNQSVPEVLQLLNELLFEIKVKYGKQCKCIIWCQELIDSASRLEITLVSNILIGKFYCNKIWGGDENWNGKDDHHLFQLFFDSNEFKHFIKISFPRKSLMFYEKGINAIKRLIKN